MSTGPYSEIVSLVQNIPLTISTSYFNLHKEEAFYFKGTFDEMSQIQHQIQNQTDLKNSSRRASMDTYLNFEINKFTKDLVNLRIRHYGKSKKNLLDLILLFKSPPLDENVFVVRFDSREPTQEKELIKSFLNSHFNVEETFQIEKVSREVWPETVKNNDRSSIDEYLNISFDEVSFLKYKDILIKPNDVFESEKIIEIEYNKDTNIEHLKNVKSKLLNNEIFKKNSKLKTDKKSIIVNRFINKNYEK